MTGNLSESPTTTDMKGPVFNRVANYFAGQPFGNLLSFLIISGFSWWFWWMQTIGTPQQTKLIQEGMKDMAVEHTKATQAMSVAHAEAIKAVSEQNSAASKAQAEAAASTFKAAIEHAEKGADRRQKDEEHKEELLRELMGRGHKKLDQAKEPGDGGASLERSTEGFPLRG